ncbi:hypothetical protein MYP_415 [Sporocytophaga myxococcoides]|uniref:Uncharacterized protein n=1 Tax=Sporocytophaga myxococcoides TaxID=153721 RepID=A0A098L8M1_9BACT|nr:hypothetical protein MYP_415 [Sporocytophaga myxococcoides]
MISFPDLAKKMTAKKKQRSPNSICQYDLIQDLIFFNKLITKENLTKNRMFSL